MKKVYSLVWQFFDRKEENNRCVAVLCKLCDLEIKYFGNTTNLRTHLTRKHPIQWEFLQKNRDTDQKQPTVLSYENDRSNSTKRKRTDSKIDSVHSDNGLETLDDEATLNLVHQMHENEDSDEEWLEEDYVQFETYKPKKKKTVTKIKRELDTTPGCSTDISQSNNDRSSEKKDEYSVFGEYIANKIRKFQSQHTRGNIQQIITTVLWQAEYGFYDDPEAVKKLLFHCSDAQHQNTTQIQEISDPATDCHNDDKRDEEANMDDSNIF